MWNMAIASAQQPVLHLVEVSFRNVLFNCGVQTTAGQSLAFNVVACWLDARPSLLNRIEEDEVVEAIRRLGPHRRRHTPGHLVGQLGFGFWLRLCNAPYEHGRVTGPRLWPAAVQRFPHCPRKRRTRQSISRAFSELRDYRNLVAHHQPIWDRDPLTWHEKAIELLGWMNADLSAVARFTSQLVSVVEAGPDTYRENSERMMKI
jgi:hypothetical protein